MLLRDGDRDLYRKLPLRPRRTPDPALGRPLFLGGSGPVPLMLALRFERRLEVSISSKSRCSSNFTLRGVGGGGERLGDGDGPRGMLRGLDNGLCSSMSSSAALSLEVQSMFGRNGLGCGDRTLGELGSSADVEAFAILIGKPSLSGTIQYSPVRPSLLSRTFPTADSRFQEKGSGIR